MAPTYLQKYTTAKFLYPILESNLFHSIIVLERIINHPAPTLLYYYHTMASLGQIFRVLIEESYKTPEHNLYIVEIETVSVENPPSELPITNLYNAGGNVIDTAREADFEKAKRLVKMASIGPLLHS